MHRSSYLGLIFEVSMSCNCKNFQSISLQWNGTSFMNMPPEKSYRVILWFCRKQLGVYLHNSKIFRGMTLNFHVCSFSQSNWQCIKTRSKWSSHKCMPILIKSREILHIIIRFGQGGFYDICALNQTKNTSLNMAFYYNFFHKWNSF